MKTEIKLFDGPIGMLISDGGSWRMATAMTANPTFFPGVTGEMFDWWFAWHPIDRLRYACWDNEDHYDVYLEDPARAVDMSLSMRERHWGVCIISGRISVFRVEQACL